MQVLTSYGCVICLVVVFFGGEWGFACYYVITALARLHLVRTQKHNNSSVVLVAVVYITVTKLMDIFSIIIGIIIALPLGIIFLSYFCLKLYKNPGTFVCLEFVSFVFPSHPLCIALVLKAFSIY